LISRTYTKYCGLSLEFILMKIGQKWGEGMV